MTCERKLNGHVLCICKETNEITLGFFHKVYFLIRANINTAFKTECILS